MSATTRRSHQRTAHNVCVNSRQGQFCILKESVSLNADIERTVQVTARYGEIKQKRTNCENAPTPCINIETAHSGLQHVFLPKRADCWTANLRGFTSTAIIVTLKGWRGRPHTGEEAAFDFVLTHVSTHNKGLMFILYSTVGLSGKSACEKKKDFGKLRYFKSMIK